MEEKKEEAYKVVVREEGNRTVFDIYDAGGRLWRQGVSSATVYDTFNDMVAK